MFDRIFGLRVPASMESLPCRRHSLFDDETTEVDEPAETGRTKVCKTCRVRKSATEYRTIHSKKKGSYERLVCRDCERAERNATSR